MNMEEQQGNVKFRLDFNMKGRTLIGFTTKKIVSKTPFTPFTLHTRQIHTYSPLKKKRRSI